jgi:hypothetical protein
MSTDKTVQFTADWLSRSHPVTFTGLIANAHRMAHPHGLFQQIVSDCPEFWLDEYRYTPESGRKAGVRAKPFKMFRDEILLPALRIYRARLENLAPDRIPKVQYSYKQEHDQSGAQAIRSILGFEWRNTPMPTAPLPIDGDTCEPTSESDDALEQSYIETLAAGLANPIVEVKRAKRAKRAKRPRKMAPKPKMPKILKRKKRVARAPAEGATLAKKLCTLADFAAV